MSVNSSEKPLCYHCGLECNNPNLRIEEKHFCCLGCKTAYEILETNELCQYYDLESRPGTAPPERGTGTKFGFLNDPDVRRQVVNISDGHHLNVTLTVPSLHCSACIWLLESLYKLNPGILQSTVNFLKKTVTVTFDENKITLQQLAELLTQLGYEPDFRVDRLQSKVHDKVIKDLLIKIGIAGFGFGNIMLFSFPEYLSTGGVEPEFRLLFAWLSLALAVPILIFSSGDFFRSAISALRSQTTNMDVPIALGILAIFIRSVIDIVIFGEMGWLDSFAGLVFLLLIGRLFQEKTYHHLSFDRDYKSYFPVSVIRLNGKKEEAIPLSKITQGDRILVRNNEIIPADSVLINGHGMIDYSFVTGESRPVEKESGDRVYAGGKQTGSSIEIDVVKDVSQSYLTQLWNDDTYRKRVTGKLTTLANRISQFFTPAVVIIAITAALFWLSESPTRSLNAFTAVLIIACPCALALSTPFTLGNLQRIFGVNGFYLKNTTVLEIMAGMDTIIFDKTGTLTDITHTQVRYTVQDHSVELPKEAMDRIAWLSRQSTHPLSREMVKKLPQPPTDMTPDEYSEIPGKGIAARFGKTTVKLGSRAFVEDWEDASISDGSVYVAYDDKIMGVFTFKSQLRDDIPEMISGLSDKYDLTLVSGDSDKDKPMFLPLFGDEKRTLFFQSPFDKTVLIETLQSDDHRIMMVGDGLNDAGALRQSDVGISVAEDVNTFSPACDGILTTNALRKLHRFLNLSKAGMSIIRTSFGISFVYNIVGIGFAVTGMLSPLISAILMPVSSISVVLFTTLSSRVKAKRQGFRIARGDV